MKVLYVTNMYPWVKNPYYGIFVREQIEGLKKHFTLDEKVYFINGRKNRLSYLISIFSINFHLLLNKYDIIHVHYGLSGLFAIFNPFIKTPIIVTLHSGDIDPKKSKFVQIFLTKVLLRKTAKTIILNEDMRHSIEGISRQYSRIPCGVNTEVFKPENANMTHSGSNNLIIFPGSDKRKEKNFPLFLEVMTILRKEYKVTVQFEKLENRSREEVCTLFNKSQCVLLTSYSEGSPQVIKEAMACNANIVSTNVGDVNVLLRDVNNAHVVDNFNGEQIARKVHDLILNKHKANGRQVLFKEGLDERSISKKIHNLYKEVLNIN